jgi:hypothetical protein
VDRRDRIEYRILFMRYLLSILCDPCVLERSGREAKAFISHRAHRGPRDKTKSRFFAFMKCLLLLLCELCGL